MTELLVFLTLAGIAWLIVKNSEAKKAAAPQIDRSEPTEDREWTSHSDTRLETLPPFSPIAGNLKINYQDFRGARTEREIDLRAFAAGPPPYLAGICKLRGGYRTFKIDRIAYAVDIDTGEEIGDLPAWLQRRYDQAPERAWEKLLADDMPALRLLLYVAKADGQFTTKERDVVVDFCQTISARPDITRQQMNSIMRDLPATSITTYRRLCGEVAKLPEAKRALVVKAAHDIVATQRTMATEEKEALEYLDKRISGAKGDA